MDATNRRKAILVRLKQSQQPLRGADLAEEFSVSRQVIVNDIALLRAQGSDIYATPQGYLTVPSGNSGYQVTIACKHDAEQLEQELVIMVEEGAQVLDVIVEHPVYGEIKANLMLNNLYDVRHLVNRLAATQAETLCSVTGGVHLHTLVVSSKEQLERIQSRLRERHLLVE